MKNSTGFVDLDKSLRYISDVPREISISEIISPNNLYDRVLANKDLKKGFISAGVLSAIFICNPKFKFIYLINHTKR